jgi:hypothetical protein
MKLIHIVNAILALLYTPPLVLTAVFRSDTHGTQVSHYLLSSIAWCHLGYLVSHYSWQRIQVLHPLLCFYRHNLERTSLGILSIILNITYYYAIYDRYFTAFQHKNALFATTILTSAFVTILNGAYVTLCIAFFFMHHQQRFANIINSERAMTFNGTLKQVLEVIDSLEHRSLKAFIQYWQHKSDDEILASLDTKKRQVFTVFAEHVDADGNHEVSYDEFVVFCHANNVFDANALWAILTHHRTTKTIDSDVIEYMLYHTLFQKKQFALAIQTDILLANWIIIYVTLFATPLLGIVISSIWGYAGAFEGNINLFQVYILAATFAMNRLAANIRFASYMAMVRPFNMGELLFIDNDVYKVTKLCPTFVLAVGRDTIVLRNSQMLDSVIRNYSRSNVFDSFALEVPLNTGDHVVPLVREKMIEYASQNWKEIDVNSIRVGWTTMENQSKVLQCNWRYNFMIYDRSRFNIIKSRFLNEVIRVTVNDVSRSVLLLNVAQGSALNNEVAKHYNSFSKIEDT